MLLKVALLRNGGHQGNVGQVQNADLPQSGVRPLGMLLLNLRHLGNAANRVPQSRER